ncbi:MAG: adenosylcobalamin-dependent ribonucleoside-diphosphate reductase [Phycisphaerae bacterium]
MVASNGVNTEPRTLKEEPILTENAKKVLAARYLKKNEAGECTETPRELFERVARTVADEELRYGGSEATRDEWATRFYNLMADSRFMPNSPTLMNAGREMGMLSACFVLPVRDSVNDIFDSIKYTALIQKAGGGTGFAFDELRPTGDYIASSGGTTSGPITFWRAFSEATNAIQQGAFRRGANMGMMYIHHPDILKFLHAKQDLTQFTNYNISVKVTDAWMEEFRADADTPHVVRNPRTGQCYLIPRDADIWKYDVKSLIPLDAEYVEPVGSEDRAAYFTSPQIVRALPDELVHRVYTKRMIWDIIVDNAWQTGEPGVIFIDRINEMNPTPHVGRIEATNPCGEQPLLPFEACNLGSVNLGKFISDACTPDADVDWAALRETVHESTRFLDNVIDANNYPLPQIDHICKANRKIGIGIMGFADALYKLNVAYNSDAGVAWGERFMKFVNDEAHACSEQLAKERGCFPNWKGSIWDTVHNRPMRNAATTTVAPTGTISIIANCSGGVEPMFSLAFIRNVLRGQKEGERPLVEVNETFRKVAEDRGFLTDDLLERIAKEGTLAHIDEIPSDIKDTFVCAHDITPNWHMHMQAGYQRHCDSSISKTINFPNAATRDQIEQIYTLAYDLRCKGVTVYRDGCREFQPMALKKDEKKGNHGGTETRREDKDSKAASVASGVSAGRETEAPAEPPVPMQSGLEATATNGNGSHGDENSSLDTRHSSFATKVAPRIEPKDLPEIVSGLRIRQMTPFGNMHVKITVDPRSGRECEIFAQLGKGGDVATSDLEGMCRVGSLWLRSGGSLKHLIKQWEGIGSSLQIPTKAGRIMSLPDGLACALKKYVRAKEFFGLHKLLLGEVDLAELDRPVDIKPRKGSIGVSPVAVAPTRRDASVPTEALGSGRASVPTQPAGSGRASVPTEPAGSGRASVPTEGNHGDMVPRCGKENCGAGFQPANAGKSASMTRDAIAQRLANDALPKSDAQRDETVNTAQGSAGILPAGKEENGHAVANGNGNGHTITATAVAEIDTVVESDNASRVTRHSSFDAVETSEVVATERGTVAKSHCTLVHQHDSATHYKIPCPECGTTVSRQEGCVKCHGCGWSQC